jgi:hypothetical protein
MTTTNEPVATTNEPVAKNRNSSVAFVQPVFGAFVVAAAIAGTSATICAASATSPSLAMFAVPIVVGWIFVLLMSRNVRFVSGGNNGFFGAMILLLALMLSRKGSLPFAAIAAGACVATWDLAALRLRLHTYESDPSAHGARPIRLHLQRLSFTVIVGVLAMIVTTSVDFRLTFRWVALLAIAAIGFLRKLVPTK